MADALHHSIFREHLEEVSFLYERRKAGLVDSDLTAATLRELEERIEAHLDALVVGADRAWPSCREGLESGEAGEVHGVTRVCCRTDRPTELREIAQGLDWKDPPHVEAFAEALRHELPASWVPQVQQWLSAGDRDFEVALIGAVGARRLPVGPAVCELAQSVPAAAATPYLWALGQLQEARASRLFHRHVQQPHHESGRTAAIGALRLGVPQAPAYLEKQAARFSWTPIPLALSGGMRVGPLLVRAAQAASVDAVLALGLHGDAGSCDALLALLGEPAVAAAAALSLHLITGAELYEDVRLQSAGAGDGVAGPVASPASPDSTGQSSAASRQDEDSPEPVHRRAQSTDLWAAWWASNQQRFRKGVRYRLGQPFLPAAALQSALATGLPLAVRQWAADELLIRFRIDLECVPEAFLGVQAEAAAAVKDQVAQAGGMSRPGMWPVPGEGRPVRQIQ
jgi:uncharacterized protein (TIGR02270 family)